MKPTPLVVKSYLDIVRRGGPGSGHFGHEGRPGEVGGSQPSDFHSAEGKKAWGRPAEQGDGTTMADGKRTFSRGWDAEAHERKEAIYAELRKPKDEDSWLSDITESRMMAADAIIDYWADIDRFESASGMEKPVPIELILPEVANIFEKLALAGGKHADLYGRVAERAKHFLAANEGDTEFVKENRTRVALAQLWMGLRLEVPRDETAFLGDSITSKGVFMYDSDFFAQTKEKVLVSRIIAGAAQAERDAAALTLAEQERWFDRTLTEEDWRNWDWVRDNMRRAETVRKAVVAFGNPVSNATASERKAQFDRMVQLMQERETELAKADPNGKIVQDIEQSLWTEQKLARESENEAYKGAVPQGAITELAGVLGTEPAPETVKVTIPDFKPATPGPTQYRVVSDDIRPQLETNLTAAKALLSMVVAPELLSKAPDTLLVQIMGADALTTPPHFTAGQTVTGDTDSVIGVPKDDVAYNTLAHEITHSIEHGSKELRNLGWMFYRYRGGGDKPVVSPLGRFYRYDRFVDPYSGYSYGDLHPYQSEVLSTGIQQMTSNPALFAAADPEFFNFMLTALGGGWLKETP